MIHQHDVSLGDHLFAKADSVQLVFDVAMLVVLRLISKPQAWRCTNDLEYTSLRMYMTLITKKSELLWCSADYYVDTTKT